MAVWLWAKKGDCMGNPQSLRGYYKYTVFAFLNGFGGSVWGGFTFYIGIPVIYLSFLNASSVQIGLVTAIFWGALAIPQFWAAYISETKPLKKYWIGGVIMTSCITWLILGLYILLTGAVNRNLSIWLFLILYILACFIKAFDVPANSALIFKLIPDDKLGKLGGILGSMQQLGMVSVALVVTKINVTFQPPVNIAVMFLATVAVSVVMSLLLFTTEEPENEIAERSHSFIAFLGKVGTILKTDEVYVKFIVGKWLMSGYYIMMAFILVFLMKERRVDTVTAGWFSSMYAFGAIVAGFTIARYNDRYGPRFMLLITSIIAFVCMMIVWLLPVLNTPLVIAIYILTGVAMSADFTGLTNMTFLCCPSEDKSTYVAITFLGTNIFTVPLPIIFGKLMDAGVLTYNSLFAILAVLTGAAILYNLLVMKNPRAFIEMRAKKAAAVIASPEE